MDDIFKFKVKDSDTIYTYTRGYRGDCRISFYPRNGAAKKIATAYYNIEEARAYVEDGLWIIIPPDTRDEFLTNEKAAEEVITLKFISDIVAQCDNRVSVSVAGYNSKYEVCFDDAIFKVNTDAELTDCLVGVNLVCRATSGE